MGKPEPSAVRRAALLFVLAALFAQVAPAQSGRRKPGSPPVPGQTTEAKPAPTPAKATAVLVSFAVMQSDDVIFDFRMKDGVIGSFVERLEGSAAVEVRRGGRGNRKDAHDLAKKSDDAHVILFQIEEEGAGMGGVGRADARLLLIRTYVYAPKTGDLKFTDTIYQRPYRSTTEVGGVRVPAPSKRVERYPSQRELEQAGRDAADRLLSRFDITLPPER
ncbi:MAG TPA: hypothetical protein VD968_13865 [Pyrinomonadaceae bacterium]|nr:hypothetical protein [Pyrinomonadaceae bacterium]